MVICDLDNTLYDWVGYFVPSFFAMFDKLLDILQCDREKLLDEFRAVHQKHHDAEHPFAVLETDTIQSLLQSKSFEEVIELIDPALYAFNSTRKKTLVAYSGVHDALRALKETDVELVAHTESKLYGAVDRLRRLDLEEYFSTIFCRERPETIHPNGFSVSDWLAKFPMEKIVELSKHQRKPNTRVLLVDKI